MDDMISTRRAALYYEKADGGRTVCRLCPRGCSVAPGGTGVCLARRNDAGELYAINYGRVTSLNLDPIEKKPLRRFHPGSMILSAGSFGCNFKCPFCQNHHISAGEPESGYMAPDTLIRAAISAKTGGNIGVAFTYNEPLIWYEYVLDAARIAAGSGLYTALVTNGYINEAPFRALLPFISAMNVDLKGDGPFYRDLCGGRREDVLRTIRLAHAAGIHVEVTTLLVSGYNDNQNAVDEAARSVAAVSEDIPLHLSRFFPRYKMTGAPPTGAAFVTSAIKTARKYLTYVYGGNM